MAVELRTLHLPKKTLVISPLSLVFLLGVPLRVGLSAISLLASFFLAQKYLQIPKSPFPNPNSQLRSQRMPLQSLTHWGLLKNNFQFSVFNFQLHKALPYAISVSPFQGSRLTAHGSLLTAHSDFLYSVGEQFSFLLKNMENVVCEENPSLYEISCMERLVVSIYTLASFKM